MNVRTIHIETFSLELFVNNLSHQQISLVILFRVFCGLNDNLPLYLGIQIEKAQWTITHSSLIISVLGMIDVLSRTLVVSTVTKFYGFIHTRQKVFQESEQQAQPGLNESVCCQCCSLASRALSLKVNGNLTVILCTKVQK